MIMITAIIIFVYIFSIYFYYYYTNFILFYFIYFFLVTKLCLVYVSTYGVPIAHLRQNKPFLLLYLGHAQITSKIPTLSYT